MNQQAVLQSENFVHRSLSEDGRRANPVERARLADKLGTSSACRGRIAVDEFVRQPVEGMNQGAIQNKRGETLPDLRVSRASRPTVVLIRPKRRVTLGCE